MYLLPPANEVWGKVISLQMSVCPQGAEYLTRYTPRTRYTPQDQVQPPQIWGDFLGGFFFFDFLGGDFFGFFGGFFLGIFFWEFVFCEVPLSPAAEHAGRHAQRAGGPHPTGKQSFFSYCFFY